MVQAIDAIEVSRRERDLGTGRGIEKSVSFRGFGRMAGFCRCEGGHGIGVCVPTHLKAHANA